MTRQPEPPQGVGRSQTPQRHHEATRRRIRPNPLRRHPRSQERSTAPLRASCLIGASRSSGSTRPSLRWGSNRNSAGRFHSSTCLMHKKD